MIVYLVERYFGSVSNVLEPVAIRESKEEAFKLLETIEDKGMENKHPRGIVTEVNTVKDYIHGIGQAKHWHINDYE